MWRISQLCKSTDVASLTAIATVGVIAASPLAIFAVKLHLMSLITVIFSLSHNHERCRQYLDISYSYRIDRSSYQVIHQHRQQRHDQGSQSRAVLRRQLKPRGTQAGLSGFGRRMIILSHVSHSQVYIRQPIAHMTHMQLMEKGQRGPLTPNLDRASMQHAEPRNW